jgi:hypothetical protein
MVWAEVLPIPKPKVGCLPVKVNTIGIQNGLLFHASPKLLLSKGGRGGGTEILSYAARNLVMLERMPGASRPCAAWCSAGLP